MLIARRWLPWVDRLDARDLGGVSTVVIHATEEPALRDARQLAESSTDFVAAHYYVDRDGAVEEWVPVTRVARHTRGYNEASIGIELVNLGRYPDHFSLSNQNPSEPFSEEQLAALEFLLDELRRRHPSIKFLKPHSDLDLRSTPASDNPSLLVKRRIDPGPMFPWDRIEEHFLRGSGAAQQIRSEINAQRSSSDSRQSAADLES